MIVVRWIFVSIVFIALLLVALQNAGPVTVQLFSLYSWQAPLVFVVLIAFATGVALGLLAAAITVARLKRQVSRLRREHRNALVTPGAHGATPGTTPASGPGFEPPMNGV